MPEVITLGLTHEAKQFLKTLSKITGDKKEMHGRNLEMEAGRGTVKGKQLVVREQVQLNHNTGDKVYVFMNLLVHNGERVFESFSWSENPLLDKLSDAHTGQYNLSNAL